MTCFTITGKLQISGIDPEIRRMRLEEIHQLELEIAAVKSRIKNESQLSIMVEGNIRVKQLEQRRQEIIQILSEEV